jgi:hypothetical protein
VPSNAHEDSLEASESRFKQMLRMAEENTKARQVRAFVVTLFITWPLLRLRYAVR